jgi:hypothetical protein
MNLTLEQMTRIEDSLNKLIEVPLGLSVEQQANDRNSKVVSTGSEGIHERQQNHFIENLQRSIGGNRRNRI